MTTVYLTDDNTTGYSPAELARLNERVHLWLVERDIDEPTTEDVQAACEAAQESGFVYDISAYNETPISVWGNEAEARKIAERLSTPDRAVKSRLASDGSSADYNASDYLAEMEA